MQTPLLQVWLAAQVPAVHAVQMLLVQRLLVHWTSRAHGLLFPLWPMQTPMAVVVLLQV